MHQSNGWPKPYAASFNKLIESFQLINRVSDSHMLLINQ